ncbi:MAG: SAM-dependent DNA methyltransferase [Bacteroidaceae bacterium]|nr:SAM-dependent DNA methyltransferase [Bacteroidaceae bacterium]
MEQSQYNQLFSFIWNIATDVLVHVFEKGDYKKIIMPMMVLRRIDVLLEPTKEKVLEQKRMLDEKKIDNQTPFLTRTTGYPFYNTSNFTMKTLKSEINPQRLKTNFIDYLNEFSSDVQDIIDKLDLRHGIDRLCEHERLGAILEKFTDDSINLSNKPVLDDEGNVRLPALDNHTMGTIFEELLRRFNEENNVTEAGEHFTPRDYVKLLADLAVVPVADKITDNTYTIYDGACGTGGILTIAQERIHEIADSLSKKVTTMIFGQELQPDTYATCKADLMISGNIKNFHYDKGEKDYIAYGSTISNDGHAGETFDFCISNPPFGTPWKSDLEACGKTDKKTKKRSLCDNRFVSPKDANTSFLPKIDDCQMLFLANNLSRMQNDTPLGTRIVEVHNGSSMFTGDAGGGASNLRQYIIENDMLEAIVAMPENDFYNTGIGTYIWIVTNRKEERRKGYVQLIDATEICIPLRKNLGHKNCETTDDDRKQILKLLMDFKETPQSKIFPNNEFGYWSVNVERPLRLNTYITEESIAECITDKNYKDLDDWLTLLFNELKNNRVKVEVFDKNCKVPSETKDVEGVLYNDFDAFLKDAKKVTIKHQFKWKKKMTDVLMKFFSSPSPDAEIVHDADGCPLPDKALEDTEIIPFRYEGGIDGFFKNEIQPYTPDAWIDKSSIIEGYELSFTKYFYKPKQLRNIKDIIADIRGVEERTNGLLNEILC